jgi:hypothetical protein
MHLSSSGKIAMTNQRKRKTVAANKPKVANLVETTPEDVDSDSVEYIAIYGNIVSNWLFLTQFFVIVTTCRYIFINEMTDWYSMTPTVLTVAAAFSREYFQLFSVFCYFTKLSFCPSTM